MGGRCCSVYSWINQKEKNYGNRFRKRNEWEKNSSYFIGFWKWIIRVISYIFIFLKILDNLLDLGFMSWILLLCQCRVQNDLCAHSRRSLRFLYLFLTFHSRDYFLNLQWIHFRHHSYESYSKYDLPLKCFYHYYLDINSWVEIFLCREHFLS